MMRRKQARKCQVCGSIEGIKRKNRQTGLLVCHPQSGCAGHLKARADDLERQLLSMFGLKSAAESEADQFRTWAFEQADWLNNLFEYMAGYVAAKSRLQHSGQCICDYLRESKFRISDAVVRRVVDEAMDAMKEASREEHGLVAPMRNWLQQILADMHQVYGVPQTKLPGDADEQ